MPYLVGAFEAARCAVKTNFDDDESKYKPIWNLMDKRWAKHYQSPLVKAGGFLNPRVFYNLQRSNPELASTCQEAFEDCVARMIPDVHQQIKVLVDSSLYINKAGRFSSEVAELAVEDLEPIRWWEHFGSRTPELRTYAMRIIGLCCSASSCERNWSTFEHFHTRRRNRLKIERLDDLVFVNYNKKLEERLQRNIMLEEDGKGKFDPIRLEELNLTSEWITDIEGESEEFVYTEEGLTWSMVEGAAGAGEHPGLSTRSGQARPFTTQAPFSAEVCERFRRTYQRSKRRMQSRMLEEIEEEE